MSSTVAADPEEKKEHITLSPANPNGKKIWIDLDNSPHVPFFSPMIKEFEKRGYTVCVSARDAYQVTDLVDLFGVECVRVGKHFGKNKMMKVLGVLDRTARLLPFVLNEKPDMALSHGSRSQLLASYSAGVPSIIIMDYEHAHQNLLWVNPTWVICPEIIPDDAIKINKEHIRRYRGIKEDVYAPSMKLQSETRSRLGVADDEILVTIRPPATEAHYHRPESDVLFNGVMEHLSHDSKVRMVLLPRNARQAEDLKTRFASLLQSRKIILPEHVIDGLNLIWYSDLVVSGGGTMNREAAALGVPVYSIFRGKIGSVDTYLAEQGRLVLLEDVEDAKRKLRVVKRDLSSHRNGGSSFALTDIVNAVEKILNAPRKTDERDSKP